MMSPLPSHTAAELLREIQHLLLLRGENPYRVRAYERAAERVEAEPNLLERARAGTLTELSGIGPSIADLITEYLFQGTCKLRDDLKQALPEGLLQLTRIPGVGPKKALLLIEALDIHSIQDLEYACRENRLIHLKGFGEKAQKKILEGIEFVKTTLGFQRLGDVLPLSHKLLQWIQTQLPGKRVSETGALRRRSEVLTELDYLAEAPHREKIENLVQEFQTHTGKPLPLPVRVFETPPAEFGFHLAHTTGSEAHWKALENATHLDLSHTSSAPATTEEEFYSKLDLPWIAPEMRETGEEVHLAQNRKLDQVLPVDGIQGVFHNHTTRSDGIGTLEEMVSAAQALGLKYIGISDHSQSAVYARGLKVDDLENQYREIQEVQDKYPAIKIFWGVESDILQDGSLDYEPHLLERFDFVIASIHSRFQMDREAMTNRILRAIQNPYTRFLGHPTGRLLLGRAGYDFDFEKIIEEATRHGVAIELNAHPSRLDIDWRWGPVLRKHQTWVSINPDAHEAAGLRDTSYGIWMARKALLPTSQVVNSKSVHEVEKWLKKKG